MEPILNSKPFDILVTHVEKEHGLVKVFGQVDLKTSQVVFNRVSDGIFGNKDVDLQYEIKSLSLKGLSISIFNVYNMSETNRHVVYFFHTVQLTENQYVREVYI